MARLKEMYLNEVAPALNKKYQYKKIVLPLKKGQGLKSTDFTFIRSAVLLLHPESDVIYRGAFSDSARPQAQSLRGCGDKQPD